MREDERVRGVGSAGGCGGLGRRGEGEEREDNKVRESVRELGGEGTR